MSADLIAFPGGGPAAAPAAAPSSVLPYLEPAPAPEYFVTDLARVHDHGSFARLLWTVPEQNDASGDKNPHNIAALKIIVPTAALPAIYAAIGKALGKPDEGQGGKA